MSTVKNPNSKAKPKTPRKPRAKKPEPALLPPNSIPFDASSVASVAKSLTVIGQQMTEQAAAVNRLAANFNAVLEQFTMQQNGEQQAEPPANEG